MNIAASPSALQPEDYDEIEAAVMETARGRWFLAEYARRAHAAETDSLRATLARIEARIDSLGAPPAAEPVPIVARLEAVVWTLRECGVDDFVCAKIESLTREIALGGVAMPPRVAAQPLDAKEHAATEASLAAQADLAERAKGDRDGGPPAPPTSAIDLSPIPERGRVGPFDETATPFVDAPFDAPPPSHHMDQQPAETQDTRLAALLWLDRLPLLDRMALFA